MRTYIPGCVFFASLLAASVAFAKPAADKALEKCLADGELKTCKKACDLGSAQGCFETGAMLDSDGEKKKALPLYDKACKLGNMNACTNLGVMLVTGIGGVTKDIARGNKLLAKGCDANDGIACSQYGNSFVSGRGVPKDIPRAIELHKKACKLGSQAACSNLDAKNIPR